MNEEYDEGSAMRETIQHYNEASLALMMAAGTLHAASFRGQPTGGLLADTQRIRLFLGNLLLEIEAMLSEEDE